MAKYQKYAEYQDSGVEWLGNIPSHWDLKRSKFLFNIVNGSTPKSGVEEYWEGDITWVTPSDLSKIKNFEISESARNITNKGLDSCGTSLVPSGSLILSCRAPIGSLAITTKEVCTNQGCKSLVVKDELNTKFIYYFLSVSTEQLNILGRGTTFLELSSDELGNFKVPFPTINEQFGIANFLDHETVKIDTLIAKQEKLIELLKEKRQAVISHAVTKGLNPNVAMKDSGVEWLGEVPEHWEVRQLRYLGSCQNGINIGAEYFGSGSPFISYGDVYRNPELPRVFEGLVQSTENDKRIYSVQRGDVLFTRTSETIEEIGFSSTCLTDVKDATFAGFLIRFRPIQNKLLPEYSKFYFRNILLRAFFVKEMNLVTRASLSQELLKKLAVPFPSLEEQKQIADFLSVKERVFDKLVNDCIKQIELLKERRTALISAAVTGKIDVRNWQHPNQKNNNNTELSA